MNCVFHLRKEISMKRLLQCVLLVLIISALFTFTGVPSAHAATRSSVHSSTTCYVNNGPSTVGSISNLGTIWLQADLCGHAYAFVQASQSNSPHINHLWIRNVYDINVGGDYGSPSGFASTPWLTMPSASCMHASGVIQTASAWANGSTSACIWF